MQKRRLKHVIVNRPHLVRSVLTCAICTIALLSLLPFYFLSPFRVSTLPGPHRIHKQREIGNQRQRDNLRWMHETSTPQMYKMPLSSQKLNFLGNTSEIKKLWKPSHGQDFVPCLQHSELYSSSWKSRGYLLVHTNGGLNQMRAGISDMVAIARVINATLVIPELDKRSFWQDSSTFSDIFDEDHFINSLVNDVRVIKKLPKELVTKERAVKHFRSWSGIEYYQEEIAKLWDNYQMIRAAKSDSRLANNDLPPDIQKLRCHAFFEALRFAPQIETLGKELVKRMKSYGHYIALHLRYEKDMLAFSGCTYGLSKDEADELTRIRVETSYWKVKDIDPRDQRMKGYCPLTPKEVGMFIAALGYPPSTPIYVAAGDIYGGYSHLSELQSRFPFLLKKEKLTSASELEPFAYHASQMAALDYIVSVESDVFIPSYSGNMARAVQGHRRFLGHRKSVTPDRKALVRLFDKIDQGFLREEDVSTLIKDIHKRRQGTPRRRKGPIAGTKGKDRFRSEEAFYENPLPDCLCSKELSAPISLSASWKSDLLRGQ